MKMTSAWGHVRREAGISLVELMVTTAILAIGVLAAIGSFKYLSVSLQNSKARTLANNLAQEQIEKLKNLSYYTLLVTTSTYPDPHFSGVVYDTGNYPPATIMEGGIAFIRGTRVDFAYQSSTGIVTTGFNANDTGIKQITTYVIWNDISGWHYQEMHNLLSNPAANPLNATFQGYVKDTFNAAIANAYIQVVDNPNWNATTNASGFYSFTVSLGSYTLLASSTPYFSNTTGSGYLSITSNQVYTVPDIRLTRIAYGTVSGYVYQNTHLVISQVVASTSVPVNGGANSEVEYVELYNPTTAPINIGTTATNNSPNIVPVFWDKNNGGYVRKLVYISTYVPVHGYYLMSNTGSPSTPPATTCLPFTVNGITVTPDACWQYVITPDHAMECGNQPCGGVFTADASGVSIADSRAITGVTLPDFVNPSYWPAARIDSVGWKKSSAGHNAPSNAVEGSAINSANAIQPNEQLFRYSRASASNSVYARAYDADNNLWDFLDLNAISNRPYTSSTIMSAQGGVPATGAIISLNDPLSTTGTCTDVMVGAFWRACQFTIPNVATGTWTLNVSSGSYFQEITSVTVNASATTSVPNSGTSPSYTAVGNVNNTLLSVTTNYAFVTGVVKGITNNPLNTISVYAGGQQRNTGSDGRYFIPVPEGDIQIIANYNNADHTYTSETSTLAVVGGQLYDIPEGGSSAHTWFTLSQGGSLVGYFQTGSNTALPNRVAVALLGGNEAGQAISGNDGHFYLANMTTGTYVVQPALDPAESSSPSSATVTLSNTGVATAVSTFTITNGLAQITGQVLANSRAITTGVLVMASTQTLSGGTTSPPPTINGATGILCNPCYYAASSDSTGWYTLNVRYSASPYKVYGWYTTFNGSTPSVSRTSAYTVTVSSTGQIIPLNLTW
jgi:hypothetical protein